MSKRQKKKSFKNWLLQINSIISGARLRTQDTARYYTPRRCVSASPTPWHFTRGAVWSWRGRALHPALSIHCTAVRQLFALPAPAPSPCSLLLCLDKPRAFLPSKSHGCYKLRSSVTLAGPPCGDTAHASKEKKAFFFFPVSLGYVIEGGVAAVLFGSAAPAGFCQHTAISWGGSFLFCFFFFLFSTLLASRST